MTQEELLEKSMVGRLFRYFTPGSWSNSHSLIYDSLEESVDSQTLERTLSLVMADGAILTLKLRTKAAGVYECVAHVYERAIGSTISVLRIEKALDGTVGSCHEVITMPKHSLFLEEKTSYMPEGCITAKQVALLQVRFRQAGFQSDKKFLEWLEFQSGLDIEADCLEQIPSSRFDSVLRRLAEV